jgi:hypothetical protein
VDVEVTDGVAVFVLRGDALILEVLDTVTDVEDVFDTDEEELTVLVLAIVLVITALRDTLIVPVDVLLGRAVRVIVVELDGLLESLAETVSDLEPNEGDRRADKVILGERELQALIVIYGLVEGLIVIV